MFMITINQNIKLLVFKPFLERIEEDSKDGGLPF